MARERTAKNPFGAGRNPIGNEPTVRVTIQLTKAQREHCEAQPGGISPFVRSLVEDHRQKEQK